MNKQKESKFHLLFWLLALLALFPLWVSYATYQKQTSGAATSECSYFIRNTRYTCLFKIEDYLPEPDPMPMVASGVLFVAILLTASFQTAAYIQERNKKTSRDLLDVLIGSKHSQDLLGEMYQMSYLYKQKSISPKTSYLFGLLDECVRRITTYYGLTPIGNPGDGPVPFIDKEQVALGHILPEENVWITQVGWRQNGRTILPSMVSKDPGQHLDGDWQ